MSTTLLLQSNLIQKGVHVQGQITITDAKAWLLIQDESGIYSQPLLDELERLQAFEAKVKEVNKRRASTGGKGAMTPARKEAQRKAVEAAVKARKEKASQSTPPA